MTKQDTQRAITAYADKTLDSILKHAIQVQGKSGDLGAIQYITSIIKGAGQIQDELVLHTAKNGSASNKQVAETLGITEDAYYKRQYPKRAKTHESRLHNNLYFAQGQLVEDIEHKVHIHHTMWDNDYEQLDEAEQILLEEISAVLQDNASHASKLQRLQQTVFPLAQQRGISTNAYNTYLDMCRLILTDTREIVINGKLIKIATEYERQALINEFRNSFDLGENADFVMALSDLRREVKHDLDTDNKVDIQELYEQYKIVQLKAGERASKAEFARITGIKQRKMYTIMDSYDRQQAELYQQHHQQAKEQ